MSEQDSWVEPKEAEEPISRYRWSSMGEHPPIDLREPVANLLNGAVERVNGRPVEMNFGGTWESPDGQIFRPGKEPATIERSRFDTKTKVAIGLGAISVGVALTAYFTYRYRQK